MQQFILARIIWRIDIKNQAQRTIRQLFDVSQKKGLTFYQTRSNAIILHNILPVACIEKVVVMNSEEALFNKICTNPLAHREKLYYNRLGTKDERILEIRTRVNPASLMRATCFLKLITEFKDYHTLQTSSSSSWWKPPDQWWQASRWVNSAFF